MRRRGRIRTNCVPAPAADAIPDALPTDLTTAPALNEFAVNLQMENVPPNVFSAPVFSEEEETKARKALPLVVEAYDEVIGLYDRNESFFYAPRRPSVRCSPTRRTPR